MCLRPLRINNPSKSYVPGVHKSKLDVPCNKCDECISRRQSDLFVRCFGEYLRCKELGGTAWFPTLTLSNEFMSWYDDPDYVNPDSGECGFRMMGCSNAYIKSFRDRMRLWLSREGFVSKDILTVRYFIVPEYGETNGRLHYHCILFVPFKLSTQQMRDMLAYAWCLPGSDMPIGWIRWSPKHGMMIKSSRALEYTMKYVGKYDKWSKKYGVEDYELYLNTLLHSIGTFDILKKFRLDALRQLYTDCVLACSHVLSVGKYAIPLSDVESYLSVKDKIKSFRQAKLHEYWSDGFGSYLIDRYMLKYHTEGNGIDCAALSDLVNGQINLSSPEFGPLKKLLDETHIKMMYGCPSYLTRKITHVCVNGRWEPKTIFQYFCQSRYETLKNRLVEQYNTWFGATSISSALGIIESDRAYIRQLLGSRSLTDLANYALVYRSRVLDDHVLLVDGKFPSDDTCLSYLNGVAPDLYTVEHSYCFDAIEDDDDIFISDPPSAKKDIMYNSLPCYSGFDELLDNLQRFDISLHSAQCAAYKRRLQETERLQKFVNPRVSDEKFFETYGRLDGSSPCYRPLHFKTF